MNRLNQSRRQTFGYVYPDMVDNNIVKSTTKRTPFVAFEEAFDDNNQSTSEMEGEGIMNVVRGMMTKGQNLIPSSDKNARPAYPGERHAILQLPNGMPGVANYMGPGTEVIKRLKRGDPPRTKSDKVAMMHDIQYMKAVASKDKATQNKLVRDADKRMVNSLNRIAKNKGDARKNIFQGRRLIQAKMKAEDLRLMKKGSFGGDLENVPQGDMLLLNQNEQKLQQEGYGLPAYNLKMKIMKQQRRAKTTGKRRKKQKGKGIGGLSVGRGLKIPGGGLNPSGGALRLAGQRGMTQKHMNTIKRVCNCEKQKGTGIGDIFKKVVKAIGPIAKEIGAPLLKDIVLPLVVKKIEKKLGGKGYPSKSKSYGTTKNYKLKSGGVRGSGLKLSGKGIKIAGGSIVSPTFVKQFVVKEMLPNLAKQVGIDLKHIPLKKIMPIVGKAISQVKSGNYKEVFNNISKVVLPILTHGKLKTMGLNIRGGMKGMGVGSNVWKGLNEKVASGAWKAFKWYFNKTNPGTFKGSGLNVSGGSWGSFFKGFKKGFKMVFKPGSKILAPIIAAENPIAGAVLGAVGEAL